MSYLHTCIIQSSLAVAIAFGPNTTSYRDVKLNRTQVASLNEQSVTTVHAVPNSDLQYDINFIKFSNSIHINAKQTQTRMWANAQRDGRPTEHKWRPLFNAAKFG